MEQFNLSKREGFQGSQAKPSLAAQSHLSFGFAACLLAGLRVSGI